MALAVLLLLVLNAGMPTTRLAGQSPMGGRLSPSESDLILTKIGSPVTRPGGEIVYQLTITNTGAPAASGLVIQDVLPPGTHYVSGGTLYGDRVEWTIPYLAGYGGVAERTLVLGANGETGTTVVNDTYSAWAYSGQTTDGTVSATTRLVDDWAWITPWDTYTLTYDSPSASTAITLPVGTVSEPMTWAYEELDQALHPLALLTRTSFRSFRLTAFRANRFAPDIRSTDSFSVVLSFSTALTAMADLSVGSEQQPLQLYRWDRGQWRRDGITCLNEPGVNRVACNVAPQELGEFVLTESRHDIYLPMVYSAHDLR
jgi:uncharacterized repeat protein (TIGR01451 family)